MIIKLLKTIQGKSLDILIITNILFIANIGYLSFFFATEWIDWGIFVKEHIIMFLVMWFGVGVLFLINKRFLKKANEYQLSKMPLIAAINTLFGFLVGIFYYLVF